MAGMMRCRDAVERLWAYLDDELVEAEHAAVEEHLQRCLRCCGEVEFARHVRHVLATRTQLRLPADVRERLEDVVDGLDPSASGR